MLFVTIELIPGGFRPQRRTIASMAGVGDYRVEAMGGRNPLSGQPRRSGTCSVIGHDRRQPVWALVAQAATEIPAAEFDEL
jgi:hypothetical protein